MPLKFYPIIKLVDQAIKICNMLLQSLLTLFVLESCITNNIAILS